MLYSYCTRHAASKYILFQTQLNLGEKVSWDFASEQLVQGKNAHFLWSIRCNDRFQKNSNNFEKPFWAELDIQMKLEWCSLYYSNCGNARVPSKVMMYFSHKCSLSRHCYSLPLWGMPCHLLAGSRAFLFLGCSFTDKSSSTRMAWQLYWFITKHNDFSISILFTLSFFYSSEFWIFLRLFSVEFWMVLPKGQ